MTLNFVLNRLTKDHLPHQKQDVMIAPLQHILYGRYYKIKKNRIHFLSNDTFDYKSPCFNDECYFFTNQNSLGLSLYPDWIDHYYYKSIDNDIKTCWISKNIKNDTYFGLDLLKVKKINQIYLYFSKYDATHQRYDDELLLWTSLNGKDWNEQKIKIKMISHIYFTVHQELRYFKFTSKKSLSIPYEICEIKFNFY